MWTSGFQVSSFGFHDGIPGSPVEFRSMSEQLRGHLEVFGFADLLQWMELNRRSGRLTVIRGSDRRALDWKDGEIVYVSGSLPRHRLGIHLLRTGALQAPVLHELLAMSFTGGGSLSRLILDGGHDTHDGLSLRVEELARRMLFELFDWREASFEYDPDYAVERILRIGLSMRGQALALQGTKNLDDKRRGSRDRRRGAPSDPRDFPLGRRDVSVRYWDLMAEVGRPIPPDEGRRLFRVFHEFARKISELARERVTMRPVYADTAAMLAELARQSPFDATAVVPVAALDPDLTLDLLILANALTADREHAVGTVPEAVDRLGPGPTRALIERLSSPDFVQSSENNRVARALRRAGVAAAIAAGRYAERFGIGRERGYTLGLLHGICYREMLEVISTTDFTAGPFRVAALEGYRPILGARRAEAWGLPLDFQAVVSDDGADPSAASTLVRTARSVVPACVLGTLGHETGDPLLAEEIFAEVQLVFEFLGLGPVQARIV
jgi:HD-like signal output (HDOD) protein